MTKTLLTNGTANVWPFIQQILDCIQGAEDTGIQLRRSAKYNGSLSNGVLKC